MAVDINPARRAELVGAKEVIEPQIRGLHDTAATSISPALRTALQNEAADREHHLALIQAELDRLDAAVAARSDLEDDGPLIPAPITIDASLIAELNEQKADQDAAAAVFVSSQATNVAVNLGRAAPKPE